MYGLLGLFLALPWALGCASGQAGAPAWQREDSGPQGVGSETPDSVGLPTRPSAEYWWNLPLDQQPSLAAGSYRSREDSLGFDAYKALPTSEQSARLESAQRKLRQGREQRDPRISQSYYATVVGLCPFLPKAWELYADTQVELGHYEEARAFVQCTERVLRYAGSDGDQRKLAASIYHIDGLAAYNMGQFEDCIYSLDLSLHFEANDREVQLLKARALIDNDQFADSRDLLDGFDFFDPYFSQAQAVLGVLEMESGNFEAADRAFAMAHEYGMRGGIFENDRGRLRLAQDRPEDAANHFEKAISAHPNLMEMRNNLAIAYYRAGDPERAIAVLEEAIAIDPSYGLSHYHMGEYYRDQLDGLQGQELLVVANQARASYSQAIALGYREAIILERRALVSLRIGDLSAAEDDLLAIAGSADAEGRVLYLLGRAKKEQDELTIAEQLYRMALEKGYRDAQVHSDLGEVLLRQADLDGAREHLELAIQQDPSLVVTRINLCVALSQLGDLVEAERALRGAEAVAPQDPRVHAQRQAFEEMKRGG